MVALRLEKDLGLVLEAAEALAVDDAVDVPLEAGAQLALGLGLSLPALLRARTPREQTSSSSARSLFSLGQLMGLTSFATIFAYTILILRSPQKPSIFPKKFSAA